MPSCRVHPPHAAAWSRLHHVLCRLQSCHMFLCCAGCGVDGVKVDVQGMVSLAGGGPFCLGFEYAGCSRMAGDSAGHMHGCAATAAVPPRISIHSTCAGNATDVGGPALSATFHTGPPLHAELDHLHALPPMQATPPMWVAPPCRPPSMPAWRTRQQSTSKGTA